MVLANMFVGAKHDRSEYGIITNNLYAVMLRPLQKPDTHSQLRFFLDDLTAEGAESAEKEKREMNNFRY